MWYLAQLLKKLSGWERRGFPDGIKKRHMALKSVVHAQERKNMPCVRNMGGERG